MLVVMHSHATEDQVRAVCEKVAALGLRAHPMAGISRTAIGITGNQAPIEAGGLEEMAGVAEIIRVTKPYKLVSRDVKEDDTVVRFPGSLASIGGAELAIMAGPCAIESREQALEVAARVRRAGAQFFRGGAYKPRTSPYSFQGLGEEGLRIMAEVRDKFGM
ncbi:MAG: 3-deoxy-7-phosphoheptulonate synthase, partial [Acidobacteria bacterium]|nr:3-deoxy-7-phosphoheptulonate synthase [Acidobacteriota bacterium]